MTITRKYWNAAISALLATTAAACGNVTAGGFTGEATVIVSGDADTLSSAAASAPTRTAPAPGPARSSHEEAEGEVEVEFLAFLVAESGAPLQLGQEELRVRVDLRGRMEADVVDRQSIPATRYTALRLVFTDIDAEVQGLVIDGVPVTEVRVELEDLSLLVSRPLDLDVTPGSTAELVVDLNTLAWLEAVDPLTGAVDEAVFQGLVNVVIR